MKNRTGRELHLDQLMAALGFSFHRKQLLAQALVHSSYAHENPKERLQHNERLEFLGDAVLDVVVSDWLYRLKPELDEGAMTRARSSVVCELSLASAAGRIGLGEYLLLGCGERSVDHNYRASILADAFEALVGAIYLDGGPVAVAQFVERELGESMNQAEQGQLIKDYKSQMQEELQKEGPRDIVYELIKESGPAHNREFTVKVLVDGECRGEGSGKTKKEAEQQAAKEALATVS